MADRFDVCFSGPADRATRHRVAVASAAPMRSAALLIAAALLGLPVSLAAAEATAAPTDAAANNAAAAAAAVAQPANEQVIVPTVERREVRVPQYPSNDFAVGLFTGTYNAQNFGSSLVKGLKLGYHITEDVFVEGTYGTTKVSDANFRQILPGGIFAKQEESLRYYNLSVGVNILPGEIFVGTRTARPSAFYLIGGVGSTRFVTQSKQTFNFGAGFRVYLADWISLQVDAREHVFSLDLLGRRETTYNPEFSAGVMVFF